MKHWLVTGGSRGIGRATASALATAGNTVDVVSRSEQALKTLQDRFPEHIRTCAADLAHPQAPASVLATFDSPPYDGMVHAAGALLNQPFSALSDADWDFLWQANVMSAVRLLRSMQGRFKPGAHIVLLSSMGGYQGSSKFPGLTAYSTTKGALSILGECLAVEWEPMGIRVNTLCLGAVATDMLAEAFPGYQAPVSAETMGAWVARFAQDGGAVLSGKSLPISITDPS